MLVQETFPNTPASGKLEIGDIIEQVNGQNVETVQQLRNVVAANAPGAVIDLKTFRKGKDVDVKVTLGEQPVDFGALGRATAPNDNTSPADSSARRWE